MAKTIRYVDLYHPNNNIAITGTENNKQTIAFADLKDSQGESLPTEFTAIPKVDVSGKYQNRDGYIGTVTTTDFEIYLGDIYVEGEDTGYFILTIVGD